MAEHSYFFDANSGDKTYSSSDFAQFFLNGLVLSDGVVAGLGNQLNVSLGSTLKVSVDTGGCWLNGRFYYNDSSNTLTVSTPDQINDRVDRVVIKVDCSIGVRKVFAYVKVGTADGSLAPPTLQRDPLVYEVSLAQFTVAANATKPSNLVDERSSSTVCGSASGIKPATYTVNFTADFGNMDTYYSTTLPAPGIKTTSNVICRMSNLAKQTEPDRSLEDFAVEGMMITVGNIIPDTSVDVSVYAPDGAIGKYVFDVIYS